MDTLRFLTPDQARQLAATYGTPLYVYDRKTLRTQAETMLRFTAPFGLTVRFAIKACPTTAILQIFDRLGLHFDASSGWEALRAMRAGVAPGKISLSTQELPSDFPALIEAGITLNACSLRQLDEYGKAFPGAYVGLRINPGLGSGHSGKTNTGGFGSSFGIWHEYLSRALEIASRHRLKVYRAHSHIGSGGNPEVWEKVALLNLQAVRNLPEVSILNLGGGFKVARVDGEKSSDIAAIGRRVGQALSDFARETQRELHLELEPGTFLMANSGSILCTIQDLTDTGADGYEFLKVDCGMTEILRPSLYGAQHPLVVVPRREAPGATSGTARCRRYLVVGHCCESGDLLSCAPGEPETLQPREMAEAAAGDLLVIEGAGAYCSGMSAKNYNSFPEAPEILLQEDGTPVLIRKPQTLEQMVGNEISLRDEGLLEPEAMI